MARLWLILATICTALTLAGVALIPALDWSPSAPFDIIGFFWLLSNLGPLLAVAGVLGCGMCAVYRWFRVFQE